MKNLNRLWPAAFAAVILFVYTSLSAGVVFTIEDIDAGDENGKPRLTKVVVQDGKVRIKSEGLSSEVSTMIFDGSAGEMMMIDPNKRTYTVIDQEALKQFAERMRQVQEQMEAAMAQVPPAQREQMKRMLGGQIPGMADQKAPEISVKSIGKSRKVSDYSTKGYDVLADGKKELTLWVTQWDDIEGSREAQASMQAMGEFFSEMFQSVPGIGSAAQQTSWINALKEIDGFPVQTIHYDNRGDEISTSTLKSVRTQDVPASEFAPPKGYKRQSLDMGK